MRRILCMFILSLLYLEVNAQLGYWYKNDFIELIPVRDSVLFVQTNEDLSAVCKDAIANKELKVVLKASKNQYIVKSEKKYLPVKSYTSVFYKHNNESNEVVILPQIVVSVSDEAVKNTILKQYQGIISISNKVKNIYEMECDLSSSDEVLLLAMQIAQIKGVNWCEPNKMFGYENYNPLYANQFYLKNTDNSGVDINVEPAWNNVNVNTNIKVAIIDCGVDKNHEDLYSNIIDGYTVVDSISKGGCILNNTSHGTACAGIVGAINNSIGIRGVASGVKIMPINVTTGNLNYYGNDIYCSESEIANAIIWAVDNGADVLSCSWGGGSVSSYIESAIDYARSEGRNGKGTIVVFAAGNNYPNPSNVAFPASYSGTIAVGAVDRYGTICSYSQRGSALDLVAPSNQILSVGEIYTTCKTNTGNINNNYTSSFGGTSAACPQVAGVAALILSARPDFTESQVRTVLQQTAKDLGTTGFDTTYGYGLVDAGAAVAAVAFKIIGPSLVCTDTPYYIENLPAGMSVVWTLENLYGGFAFHTDTPSANQCTLTKVGGDFHATLKASIYYNNSLFATSTKYVYSLSTNYGTYSQESCWYYNVQHPAITTKNLKTGEAMFVHQGCWVTLHSNYFEKASVSHSGATPDTWFFDPLNKTLIFSLPLYSSGIPFMIDVDNDNSCGDVRFTFFSVTNNGNITSSSLNVEPEANGYLISVTRANNSEESVVSNDLIKENWELEIYNANWGTKKLGCVVSENKYLLNTTGWDAGIYVIRAVVNGEVYTEKITVK